MPCGPAPGAPARAAGAIPTRRCPEPWGLIQEASRGTQRVQRLKTTGIPADEPGRRAGGPSLQCEDAGRLAPPELGHPAIGAVPIAWGMSYRGIASPRYRHGRYLPDPLVRLLWQFRRELGRDV